jgi:hypothetical protein
MYRSAAQAEHRNRESSALDKLFLRRGFYRGGFAVNGLRALYWRIPISISCNVALGDPNERAHPVVNGLQESAA